MGTCTPRGTLLGLVLLLAGLSGGLGQSPAGGGKKGPQGPPDEDKEILRQIKEAYKAPFEVHQDVLDELRKSYQKPSLDREATIFKEIRRLYVLTAEQEAALLREIRKNYGQPSVDQEKHIFSEIFKLEKLPEGAVPESVQVSQAGKLFGRLDANGDGRLSADEMSATLHGERGRWDTSRDGFINLDEYWGYYQGRLRWLSQQVSAGNIDLGLKRGGPAARGGSAASIMPAEAEEGRPTVYRAGKLPKGLPPWFEQLDANKDGQVSLAEWRKTGKSLTDFAAYDHNDDGLLTPLEMLRYQAQIANGASVASAPDHARPSVFDNKGKKKK